MFADESSACICVVKVVRVRVCPGFIHSGRRNVTTEK
jgi:hypothetical protein